MENKKLDAICKKYCNIQHNDNNYGIGGGLDSHKFASRRHEDAREDEGKLTLGQATQLFKKATGIDVETIKEVIEYAVPNMEWHHAGKLPKQYGGGMKKTYFLNAEEICKIASNWQELSEKYELSKIAEKERLEVKKHLQAVRHEFLQLNAKKVERITKKPEYFYQTAQEMNGKFGWFDSSYKSYNMTEYYSGWEFETEEKYNEFLNIN